MRCSNILFDRLSTFLSQGLICSNTKVLMLTANSLKTSSTEQPSQVCVCVCVCVSNPVPKGSTHFNTFPPSLLNHLTIYLNLQGAEGSPVVASANEAPRWTLR